MLVDDDLLELEARQKARLARHDHIRFWVGYVAAWLVYLTLMAVEWLLPAGSIASVLLGWLGILPGGVSMVAWTAEAFLAALEANAKREAEEARQGWQKQAKEQQEKAQQWELMYQQQQEGLRQQRAELVRREERTRNLEEQARQRQLQAMLDRENGYERKPNP